jgi:transcriptional regulator with XRE-family HTH domain
MLRSNVPRAVRVLRRRRGWRQADLGRFAGMSRETVSRIERGDVRGITLRSLERAVGALGATIDVTVRWEGEQLDRLVDSTHASVQERVARQLREAGWSVRVEVSFNHYGDRGRVDVLAFHAATGLTLVLEVKSALGELQDTLGRLDVKARLGSRLSTDAGWDARGVVRGLVIADSRTARRVVSRHGSLFSQFDVRGRAAVAWVHRPSGRIPSGVLWFVALPDSRIAGSMRGSRVRIDRRRP